ncbi:MAG: pre-peptidase C-terminal domain-containing protein [Verrucomicrobia bacterium]|nr:pre-peptidase C-terminal domain-containing protein [Verrucomicrobiota bacterium]
MSTAQRSIIWRTPHSHFSVLALLFLLAATLITSFSLHAQNYSDALEDILTWTSGGTAPWYVQGSYFHKDSAVSSGGIGDNQESWLETIVEGPGNLAFWWKVSSEGSYDFLSFLLDAKVVDSISGEVDWQERTMPISSGTHTFRWRYTKDKAFTTGMDHGFLDQVRFVTPAAVITEQPVGTHQKQGTLLRLSVGTTGDNLKYQWRRGDLAVIGATDAVLLITNALATHSGRYDVVVKNSYNSVTSQPVSVDIYIPLPMPSRPTLMGTVVALGPTPYGGPPADMTNAVSVVRSVNYMGAALKSDGTVVPWGWSGNCLFCIPGDLTNAVALSAGYDYIMALRDNGTITVWGQPSSCQAGCIPPGLSNVVAIAAGYYHCLALRDDGTVVAWGGNQWGQVSVPNGLNDTVSIAAGFGHSLAARRDGTVVSWGLDDSGQVSAPHGQVGAIAVAASFQGHASFALKRDGTVLGWGSLDGSPTLVPSGLQGIVRLAPGVNYCVAQKLDGTIVAWGAGIPPIPPSLNNILNIAASDGGSSLAVVTIPLTNPNDLVSAEGSPASFTVVPQGPGQFSFQWYFNGILIPRATNSLLTLNNLKLEQAGTYTVAVLTDQRRAVSRPAKLTVTPKNDSFTSATVITGGGGIYHNSNSSANSEPEEPNHLGAYGGHSIWYQWTAPATGTVTIDTIGSTFDTVLAAYIGDSLSSLEAVAADDDGANFNHNSLLTFPCTAGITYHIAVDGFSGASGGVQLTINPLLEIIAQTLTAPGSLEMKVFTPIGQRVILESTSDFRTWVPVRTNTSPANGILVLGGVPLLKSSEFYRTRLQ